jgi:hypothetical protein
MGGQGGKAKRDDSADERNTTSGASGSHWANAQVLGPSGPPQGPPGQAPERKVRPAGPADVEEQTACKKDRNPHDLTAPEQLCTS